MPVLCPIQISPITDFEFQYIDSAVLGYAYASQNELGRLSDERVYENDVASRLRAEGFSAIHTQVPLTVRWNDFEKIYRLDLVVNQMVYELKTVAGFDTTHEAQVIHYADRIKLLNFRSPKVKGQLKRCPFLTADRHAIESDRTRWQPKSEYCETLATARNPC